MAPLQLRERLRTGGKFLLQLLDVPALFGKTPRAEWLAVDEGLAGELAQRLEQAGYRGGLEEALKAWAGTENLELRVDGIESLDPVVLEQLRSQTA